MRFRPYLGQGGLYSDGARTYDPAGRGHPVRYAVWEAPEALPEPVNSAASETRPALSSDGRVLVFASGERGSTRSSSSRRSSTACPATCARSRR
jgi:hypothetical protein